MPAQLGIPVGLKELDADRGIILEKPVDFEVKTTKKAESFDFVAHLDAMAKTAEASKAGKSALKLTPFDIGRGLTDLSRAEFDETAGLLSRAMALITGESWQEALGVLRQLLAATPDHSEAQYLVAFCHVGLTDPEEALTALLPLRQVRLDGNLAERVLALRQQIRGMMLLPLLIQNLLLSRTGRHELAVQHLQHVVSLDPDHGFYHFLLGGTLMQADRLPEAVKAADAGLAVCPAGEREPFVRLRGEVERRFLLKEMAPARDLYKQGRYADARRRLQHIDREFHRAPLFVTFDRYLTALGGNTGFFARLSASTPAARPAPAGSFKEVDALHFFLVSEELAKIREHLDANHPDSAEPVALEAVRHAPAFPYGNFLCAASTYARLVSSQLEGGHPPKPEDALRDMERAQACARVGATDTEIGEAKNLLEAVGNAVAMLRTVLTERDAMKTESKPVNAAMKEFMRIMKQAEGGIKSPRQLKKLHSEMSTLKDRVAGLKKSVRSKAAKEAVDQLDTAVRRNYGQLEDATSEFDKAARIKPLFDEFRKLMEARKRSGPIRSYGELAKVVAEITSLKNKVDAELIGSFGSPSAKPLNDLSGSLGKILEQLRQ